MVSIADQVVESEDTSDLESPTNNSPPNNANNIVEYNNPNVEENERQQDLMPATPSHRVAVNDVPATRRVHRANWEDINFLFFVAFAMLIILSVSRLFHYKVWIFFPINSLCIASLIRLPNIRLFIPLLIALLIYNFLCFSQFYLMEEAITIAAMNMIEYLMFSILTMWGVHAIEAKTINPISLLRASSSNRLVTANEDDLEVGLESYSQQQAMAENYSNDSDSNDNSLNGSNRRIEFRMNRLLHAICLLLSGLISIPVSTVIYSYCWPELFLLLTQSIHINAFQVSGSNNITTWPQTFQKPNNSFFTWLSANFLGIFLVLPVILSLREIKNLRVTLKKTTRCQIILRVLAAIFLYFMLALVTVASYRLPMLFFSHSQGLGIYFNLPILVLIANFFGCFGTYLGCFIIGCLSISMIVQRPDISETDQDTQFSWLQLYLAVAITTCIAFIEVFEARRRAYSSVERKVIEKTQYLTETLEKLQAAQKKIEMNVENKMKFLAYMCHEIRNPVHAIVNLSEIIIENVDQVANGNANNSFSFSEAALIAPSALTLSNSTDLTLTRDQTNEIRGAAKSLNLCSKFINNLISDILNISKFEAGRIHLEYLPISLAELLEETGKMLADNPKFKGKVAFSLQIDALVPSRITFDSLQLQQVVHNLLSNAFKFTPSGGMVKLSVSTCDNFPIPPMITARIREEMMSSNSNLSSSAPINIVPLLFQFADTGIGMTQDAMNRIFEPYTQASVSTAREYGGTGLGLYIVQEIVKMAGGSITVTSEVGVGTTFHVILPVGRCEEASTSAASSANAIVNNTSNPQQLIRKTSPIAQMDDMKGKSALVASLDEIEMAVIKMDEHNQALDPSKSIEKTMEEGKLGIESEVGSKQQQEQQLRKGPVLVVDDSTINRQILMRIFRNLGLEVLQADNGKSALSLIFFCSNEDNGNGTDKELFDQDPEKYVRQVASDNYSSIVVPSLIMMDLNMPLMNGLAATRIIRSHPLFADVPIIACTANCIDDHLDLLNQGFSELAAKPFLKRDAEALLEKYCIVKSREE